MPTMPTALPPSRLLTAEDLLEPGIDRDRGELWDGVLVVRDPSGGWSSSVAGNLMLHMGLHVREWRLGRLFIPEQGFVVARGPDRVLVPDLAYVSFSRLARVPERGFVEGPPDLAVEVRSPTDAWAAVLSKCVIWTGHGTPLVWAVDPESRTLVAFRPKRPPRTHGLGDETDGSPVLPEFRLRIADLFEGLT